MDIKFNKAQIKKALRQRNYDDLSLYIRGKGYKRLFFNHSVISVKYLADVFGGPNTCYDSSHAKRWFISPALSGTWIAFKSDQDAIYYKLMGLGMPEEWEIE